MMNCSQRENVTHSHGGSCDLPPILQGLAKYCQSWTCTWESHCGALRRRCLLCQGWASPKSRPSRAHEMSCAPYHAVSEEAPTRRRRGGPSVVIALCVCVCVCPRLDETSPMHREHPFCVGLSRMDGKMTVRSRPDLRAQIAN